MLNGSLKTLRPVMMATALLMLAACTTTPAAHESHDKGRKGCCPHMMKESGKKPCCKNKHAKDKPEMCAPEK